MLKIIIVMVILSKNAVGLNPEGGDFVKLKNCVAHTIQNIFDKNKPLLFLSDVGGAFPFPDAITNPYAIANKRDSIRPDDFDRIFSNDGNIVAHFVNGSEFYTFSLLIQLLNRQLENSLLFITRVGSVNEFERIFKRLWQWNFYNVAVIGYTQTNADKRFSITSWASATRRKNLSSVAFGGGTQTVNSLLENPVNDFTNIIRPSQHVNFNTEPITIVYTHLYTVCLWCVPPPKRISPLLVLKIIFKPLVWLLIVLAVCLTSLGWWLVYNLFRKTSEIGWSDIFFDVYSITMLASTTRVPVRSALRYAFISYVVYVIHIQAAFTSNLVNILTIPQYEAQIKNLKDLADSNLPILVSEDTNRWLRHIEIKNPLYKTIHDRFVVLNMSSYVSSVRMKYSTNHTSLWFSDDFKTFGRNYQIMSDFYFIDNSISGTIRYVFYGYSKVNLWPAFNLGVTSLIETGIVDHFNKLFVQIDEEDDWEYDSKTTVITIKHLCSVFVLWGLGLLLAFLVFLIELLVKIF
ncbi:hypothetical protein FQR65_LT08696 [Abscondita terminalis]|nr:hypothetical protein FQR65_LT08696 [Abscondita terminalis]